MKNANPVSRLSRGLTRLVVLTLLAGCGQAESKTEFPRGIDHRFSISVGERNVEMQLAISGPEMSRGLMERTDLKPDEGMLFVYNRPQRMSFWMRNTPTPLDIGFFDSDGVLREVYALFPFDETPVRSRRDDLQYALEMNLGWFAQSGVKVGEKLDLPGVAAGVAARGFPVRGFIGLDRGTPK